MLDHPTEMLNHFDSTPWQMVAENLNAILDGDVRNLKKTRDPVEIHRLQGRIEILEYVISFPEQIKKYLRDKKDGKVKGK